jgi:iron complex outermembrane receptor protein
MCHRSWRTIAIAALSFTIGLSFAEAEGRIEGRVTKDGDGVEAVVVLVQELQVTELTDEEGRFVFEDVAAGRYTLVFTLGENVLVRDDVFVLEGGVHSLEAEVDWDLGLFEEVKVTAGAARAAKIVDAPAAVTEIEEEQLQREAAHGQVPKVLEFTPGAEVTQSGLYDFNFNTRGFNSSLNRRVSTYIDGRDVGVVLLGAQEWAAISGGLDDVSSLEFIRGPSAALYGANASSGVINITTKAPRDSLGSFVRLTAGELSTRNADFRWAGDIGGDWYAKVTAGVKNSGDFTVSRNPDVSRFPEYSEYCALIGETDCLPAERTLIREQDNDITFGSVRFDKYLDNNSLITFEAGLSDIEGPVAQTGIGRVQIVDATRPFYRLNYSSENWNVLAHYAAREGDQVNLTADLVADFGLLTDTKRYGVEAQGNWNFGSGDRGRFVIGAAYTEEEVDTLDAATGLQTVVWEPIKTDRQAIFSQLDWRASDRWKFVLAGRVDWNDLHDTQFSPKAAVVYSIDPKNSLRLTYNRAFQVANYSEFFLHTRISAFPIGGFVRTICEGPLLQEPVDCGIDENFIPILAVGNDDLDLERTTAWEIGYSGLWWNRVFLTIDYYNAENEDFITDLVPQVGTVLGNLEGCVDRFGNPATDPAICPINNDYLPWVGPEEAETTIIAGTLTVARALRNAVDNSVGGNTLGFRLAQDLDGSTVVVGRTYSNVGQVDTQGVDFGMQYFISNSWNVQLSYSWFDFEIIDSDPEIEEILLPNTPENKASLAVSFATGRWAASLAGRWVEAFRWSAGVFQGDVPDYSTVDFTGSFDITDNIRVGVNVANVFDNVHRQTFGGDLLTRRALTNLSFRW